MIKSMLCCQGLLVKKNMQIYIFYEWEKVNWIWVWYAEGSRWIQLTKEMASMLLSGIQRTHNWESLTSHFHVLAVELDGSRESFYTVLLFLTFFLSLTCIIWYLRLLLLSSFRASLLLGFVCPLMWYYATILYFGNYYRKDPRERAGLAACAIAVSVVLKNGFTFHHAFQLSKLLLCRHVIDSVRLFHFAMLKSYTLMGVTAH